MKSREMIIDLMKHDFKLNLNLFFYFFDKFNDDESKEGKELIKMIEINNEILQYSKFIKQKRVLKFIDCKIITKL